MSQPEAPRASLVHDDEDLTDLGVHGWQVLQKKHGFRFSLDAVLLAHFIHPQKDARLLDLGAGSGVISFLLAARQELFIDAVELQPQLADMMSRSVAYNGLTSQIRASQGDLTALAPRYHGQYDWVVCNPPFFPLNRGKQSPNREIALARHEIACTLDDVIACAARCLKPQGRFALVQRAERLAETLVACRAHGLRPARLRLIHPDAQKNAMLLLLEAQRGGRGNLIVLPPLLIYDGARRYTPEVAAYFTD